MKNQRKNAVSNTYIGKEFQDIALQYFIKKGIYLQKEYKMEIGLNIKKYIVLI